MDPVTPLGDSESLSGSEKREPANGSVKVTGASVSNEQ